MQQLKSLTDQELISLYLNNHPTAFETLLKRHRDKVYTSIYLFVKDTETAEDIFQEVFIKIIDTLRKGKYKNEDKFQQWAMRIAYNLCVDHFRKSKKMSFIAGTESFSPFDIIGDNEGNMEQSIIKSEINTRLRKLIDQLPDEQREVVILRNYADMSFKEIAQMTNVSINTSLGRMRYALINLRKLMTEAEMVA